MGAKWGFQKFPLDPDRAHPPALDELSWRALPAHSGAGSFHRASLIQSKNGLEQAV